MGEDTRALQPYEIIEYEGQEARRYPDGVIRSTKGYVLSLPPDVARELERRRRAIGEERAREGIMKGTQSDTPEDAVMKIVRARAIVAITDQGRPGNDAAKLVLQAAGYLNPEKTVQVSGEVNHKVAPQLPQDYLDYVRRRAAKEVIEGSFIDEDEG